MKESFWLERWNSNQIGFHAKDINPFLLKYYPNLNLNKSSFIFVPLCGKTNDMIYLASLGNKVIGIEFSEKAIIEFFTENQIPFSTSKVRSLTKYSSDSIDIFHGDFFSLSSSILGPIDMIYDRAALIALPETIRTSYYKKIAELVDEETKGIVISIEYDQSKVAGPPFSVKKSEIVENYKLKDLKEIYHHIPNELKDRFGDIIERIYLCN